MTWSFSFLILSSNDFFFSFRFSSSFFFIPLSLALKERRLSPSFCLSSLSTRDHGGKGERGLFAFRSRSFFLFAPGKNAFSHHFLQSKMKRRRKDSQEEEAEEELYGDKKIDR